MSHSDRTTQGEGAVAADGAHQRDAGRRRVAYIVSRFPKTTETFIVREIRQLEALGTPVELFTLIHESDEIVHPLATELARRVRHVHPRSPDLWAAQLHWLTRAPVPYLSAWWSATWGNRRSLSFVARALLIVPLAAWFAREIERMDIDRVHAHWATHATLAAYVVRRLTGVPYSFTTHAHDLYANQSMLAEKIAAADFVVTISDHNAGIIAERFGADAAAKTHVVRCGVDVDQYRPAAGLGSARRPRPSLVCVASLEEYKGHRHLVDALAILRDRGIEVRCTLVGEGSLRSELERRIRDRRLSDAVEFVGQRSMDEVRTLVAAADLFVLASVTTASGRIEGIPVALMEALALGVPCVATDVSGVAELIRHDETGVLVPERDASALAAGIASVLDRADRGSALAARGRELVVERYNITRNVTSLRDLLTRERSGDGD